MKENVSITINLETFSLNITGLCIKCPCPSCLINRTKHVFKKTVGKLIIAKYEGKQKDKLKTMNIQKVYFISFWNTKILFSEN